MKNKELITFPQWPVALIRKYYYDSSSDVLLRIYAKVTNVFSEKKLSYYRYSMPLNVFQQGN